MPNKPGKKYTAAAKQVEARLYGLAEAVPLVQKIKFTKFNETVEVHMRLGVDPKQADQMVRGTIVLPNGLGKAVRVLVIASGEKIKAAEDAGADFFGSQVGAAKLVPRMIRGGAKPQSGRVSGGKAAAKPVRTATELSHRVTERYGAGY